MRAVMQNKILSVSFWSLHMNFWQYKNAFALTRICQGIVQMASCFYLCIFPAFIYETSMHLPCNLFYSASEKERKYFLSYLSGI